MGVGVDQLMLGLVCGCAMESQLMPWPEQLERLQARACWEDREALLHLCIVSPPFSYSETFTVDADQSLLIGCDFMCSDGSTFELEFDDLHMRGTLQRTKAHRQGWSVDPATIQALQHAQGAPQVGPREVLVGAQPYSEDFQEHAGPIAMTSAILLLGEWSEERTGLPAIWSISHYSFTKETEYIWVSALDGTIVERAEADE